MTNPFDWLVCSNRTESLAPDVRPWSTHTSGMKPAQDRNVIRTAGSAPLRDGLVLVYFVDRVDGSSFRDRSTRLGFSGPFDSQGASPPLVIHGTPSRVAHLVDLGFFLLLRPTSEVLRFSLERRHLVLTSGKREGARFVRWPSTLSGKASSLRSVGRDARAADPKFTHYRQEGWRPLSLDNFVGVASVKLSSAETISFSQTQGGDLQHSHVNKSEGCSKNRSKGSCKDRSKGPSGGEGARLSIYMRQHQAFFHPRHGHRFQSACHRVAGVGLRRTSSSYNKKRES